MKIPGQLDESIEVVIDGPMSTTDAIMLALTLQDLTIQTSHRNIAKREKRNRKP